MSDVHCHVGSACFEHVLDRYVAQVHGSMCVLARRTRILRRTCKMVHIVGRYESAFGESKFVLFSWFALLCNLKFCFKLDVSYSLDFM